ncbi:MAG TPA: feruloyl-CoA synthase [Burkholderiaceae bacterium]|nr:feruloyl-CoA synthase [Burkholderiaceae bacterium]
MDRDSQALGQTQFFDDPAMLAPPCVERIDTGNGTFVLRSTEPLGPYARCVGEWLEHWAANTPDALCLAERSDTTPNADWRRMTYRQVRHAVGAIAQSLLDLELPPGRPVVVLSDNGVDHALLMLASMHIGRPVCTVSSAYCRLTKDYAKIYGILHMLEPALIYAADASIYGPPVESAPTKAVTVFSKGADNVSGALSFARLLESSERPAVMAAFRRIEPDDHAKYLLTSGSTGHPKVAINTHRMLCANQQMIAQTWRFLEREKPVLLDWLPWSHTFGGNHNLNLVLRNGGALYIDEGRPAPGLIEKTARNLGAVKPTLHFNVPRGLDMLLPILENDAELARDFFSRLRMVFYAGAALPQAVWERLQALATRVRGEPVWLTTSWGSTETAPAATTAHWRLDRAGCIGAPLPGVELKFTPSGEKLEMRVRGVTVFPGYRNAPDLTAAAFDEEGFYKIGDAGYLVDPERPEKGVAFNGRVAEDFKLSTGTWVSVGTLRLKVVSALAPLAQDAVITGHDRDEIGALIFPGPATRELSEEELRRRVREALGRLSAEGGGSSQCPRRAVILSEPPSVDTGEITDKGYINQRAVLNRRAAEVLALYAKPTDPRVIVAG